MGLYLDYGEGGSDWIKGGEWSMLYVDPDGGGVLPVTTADQMLISLGASMAPHWLAQSKVEHFMSLRASDAMPDGIFEELVARGLIAA